MKENFTNPCPNYIIVNGVFDGVFYLSAGALRRVVEEYSLMDTDSAMSREVLVNVEAAL